jgi:hypothetical protein
MKNTTLTTLSVSQSQKNTTLPLHCHYTHYTVFRGTNEIVKSSRADAGSLMDAYYKSL